MIIKSISTLRFLELNGSSPWDNNGGPGLYLIIRDGNFSVVYEESTPTNDCVSGTAVPHQLNQDITLTKLSERYKFQILGYDGIAARQLIGTVETVPYIKGEKFPKSKTLTFDGLTVQVFFEYEF